MSALLTITEGWTQELGPFELLVDGEAFDLTGLTVTPIIRNPQGALITVAGTLRYDADLTLGKVYFTPAAADFALAGNRPYTLHFQVLDGTAKAYFPNGAASEIAVYKR